MAEFDLEWFTGTPFGAAFTDLEAPMYDLALGVAAGELAEVKRWCPNDYPTALQIKLSILIPQISSATAAPGTVPTTRTAYVIADKVMDTERRFELVEQDAEIAAASPAGILRGIVARCKAPLMVGATLARSLASGSRCGCGPDPMMMGADKADN